MSQQLVKKGTNGKYSNVNPKSWTEAIKDKNTGQTLVEILQGFNMYFLSYTGDKESTRCLVPNIIRKKGLWITYVDYDNIVHTEWYAANSIEDDSWKNNSNWRIGNNMLVGDISISSKGNWVINGKETSYKAIGERGYTPILRVGSNNKLQVSYDEGYTYSNVSEDNVFTQFRIIDNKLNFSTDLGKTWNPVSDYIASWIRWQATSGDTQANNVGRIQISRDNKTWTNLSNDIINNLHISKYINVNDSLPTSDIAEGTIYAKGPYYAEDDTLNDNPIYRLWVYAWKDDVLAWVDNGEFTSITAGIIQETGNSETEVMSQKAVTKEFSKLRFFKQSDTEGKLIAKSYEQGLLGMFIDISVLNISYLEMWYYDTGLENGQSLNVRFKRKGSDEIEWLLKTYSWANIEEDVPIPLVVNDTIVGSVAIKDKAVFSTYPKGYQEEMNVDVVTKDIQYGALNRDLSAKIEELNETIGGVITGKNKAIYVNEGEVEYYSQYNTGYKAYMMCQVSGTIAVGSKVNKIVAGPLRIEGASTKCFYEVYMAGSTFTFTDSRTLIQKGEIEVGKDFKECTIFLENVLEMDKSRMIAIAFYTIGNDKIQILGTNNEPDIPVYATSRTGLVLTSPISEGIDSVNWEATYINNSTKRGFAVVQPRIYLQTGSVSVAEFEETKADIYDRIENLENMGSESHNEEVSVQLPSKLYAVVGDTLQVFYRSIIKDINPYNYDIVVSCSKGATYPRYWQYTPSASDVGTVTLSISLKNKEGKEVGSASTTLVTTASPISPSKNVKVFTFGDSLTAFGQWVGEAKRRLVNTNSVDGIAGKGLTNISFCGAKNADINSTSVDYFGVGGWSWSNYLTEGSAQYRVYVSNVNTVSLNSKYTNNGNTYTVIEVNVTSGSGNLLLSGSANAPSNGGILTKTSGDGDASISFTSYEKETTNPLWDTANGKMSFIPYVNKYGGGQIDAVYVLLGWNGLSAWKEYNSSDVSGHINNAKIFAKTLHSEYPNAKLKIMGLQLPSLNGGLGANYGSSGGYSDLYGLCYCVLSYNKALKDLCNLEEFSGYCEYVDIATQFDSENNMPESSVNVNTRNTKKEFIGTNGVHPSISGYNQIADVVYRNIVANYCK